MRSHKVCRALLCAKTNRNSMLELKRPFDAPRKDGYICVYIGLRHILGGGGDGVKRR